MNLQDLKADTKLHRDRLLEAKLEDVPEAVRDLVRAELANNVWPWLEAMVDMIDGELGDLNEALDELIDNADSVLQAQASAQLASTLQLFQAFVKETGPLVDEMGDELKQKRLKELGKTCLRQYEISIELLRDITVDVEGEPVEDGQTGGETDDGETEDEPDKTEDDQSDDDATPVETPKKKTRKTKEG